MKKKRTGGVGKRVQGGEQGEVGGWRMGGASQRFKEGACTAKAD